MLKKDKKTVVKPLLLVIHQSFALYIIFYLLSLTRPLLENEILYLYISFGYIVITSLFISKMLMELKKENKKTPFATI